MDTKLEKIRHHLFRNFRRAYRHFWDHIVPHEGNNHHPHLLKHRVLIGYSVVLILLKVLVIIAPIALPSSSLFSSAITPQNVIALTNQTRINLGLSELKPNDKLTIAAQNKARDMLNKQYFSHTGPSGITPWNWIKDAGYIYRYAGENLAVHFFTSESVSEGWMASPTHKANIVNSNFTDIGVGVVMGNFEGYDTSLVVQMFGTPLSLAAKSISDLAVTTIPTAEPVVNIPPVKIVDNTADTGQVKSAESINKQDTITEPVDTKPIINDSGLKVNQLNDSYSISLEVAEAKSVTVHLASQYSDLQFAGNNEWQGAVSFDALTINKNGELLTVTVVGKDGTVINRPLAWLAPKVSTQNLYNFNEGNDKFTKFFGLFTVHNLDDNVRQFYLFFVIFLAAALLLNIFIKIRIQRVSVIAHSMIVMALALFLTII